MSAATRTTVRAFDGLLAEIDRAARLAADPERSTARADAVSHWSVRQQLDHLLITDAAILDGIRQGLAGELPAEAGGKPTMTGRIVLWTGHIPRGKARAPEMVLPGERPVPEIAAGFRKLHSEYEALTDSLGDIQRNKGTQPHPILGHFNSAQWLRFAHLHHRHHWKIIEDILRASTRGSPER